MPDLKNQATSARGSTNLADLLILAARNSKGDFGLILCCDQSEAIKFKLGPKMVL